MFRHERKKASETQIYTRSEEAQLKRMAWDDFENRIKVHQLSPLAVLFQFETGVRIGELVALRYEDVNGRYLHVQRMWRRDAKEIVEHTKGTYGDREVILTSEALRIIESAWKRQEELGVSTHTRAFYTRIYSFQTVFTTLETVEIPMSARIKKKPCRIICKASKLVHLQGFEPWTP